MEKISVKNIYFKEVSDIIKNKKDVELDDAEGQRFIGAGTECKTIIVYGTPGNALGAYLNGTKITVFGNAQDAVGDTMNDGEIIVHGSVGDAVGYAMRGGEIYVKGKAGYRAGIHMKEYKDKKPVLVIGESAGSFLGEYQAGGIILVLNLKKEIAVGDFCGTGMHGGKMFIRTDVPPKDLPEQVKISEPSESDLNEIAPYVKKFAELFSENEKEILNAKFYVLTPNSANPYKQLYVQN